MADAPSLRAEELANVEVECAGSDLLLATEDADATAFGKLGQGTSELSQLVRRGDEHLGATALAPVLASTGEALGVKPASELARLHGGRRHSRR